MYDVHSTSYLYIVALRVDPVAASTSASLVPPARGARTRTVVRATTKRAVLVREDSLAQKRDKML